MEHKIIKKINSSPRSHMQILLKRLSATYRQTLANIFGCSKKT